MPVMYTPFDMYKERIDMMDDRFHELFHRVMQLEDEISYQMAGLRGKRITKELTNTQKDVIMEVKGDNDMAGAIEKLEQKYNIKREILSNHKRVDWNDPSLSKIPDIPQFSIKTNSANIKLDKIKEVPLPKAPVKEEVEQPVEESFDFETIYGAQPDYQGILNECMDMVKRFCNSKNNVVRANAKNIRKYVNNLEQITAGDVRKIAEAVHALEAM